MREAIAIIENTKLSYTDLSAFSEPVMFVHAQHETVLKIQYIEDCYCFYDYRSEYQYVDQTIDDLELHIKSIDVGIVDDLPLNGNVNRQTLSDGAFLE